MSNPLFIPSFLRSAVLGSRPIQLVFNDVKDTNVLSTSSFIYDPPRSPLKSSQQLHVDWSSFENHTFFMNAEAKVNIAFDQIINGYPFDGSKVEVEKFFEGLSGFDNWVFESLPKFRGQLQFSGSWIDVNDHAGALFPELSSRSDGTSVLTPNDGKSMTIEMHVHLPTVASAGQTIFQKIQGTSYGFSFYVLPSTSSVQADAIFAVMSGSSNLSTTIQLNKGMFEQVSLQLDREVSPHVLRTYKEGILFGASRDNVVIDDLPIENVNFLIGSGSTTIHGSTTFTPTSTLSGTLDEFRVFHSLRSVSQMKEYAKKSLFKDDDMKLYYRFNEPPPPLVTDASSDINGIVLDSSGNSLHSFVTNFSDFMREDASTDPLSRMTYEKSSTAPVLFTANADVTTLNQTLLYSASLYDSANPNLITKLVPQHYLQEGQSLDGLSNIDGTISLDYTNEGIPGSGKLGSSQLLVSFLYIYARFFDELKIFVDSFKNLRYVDYDTNENVPDNFLLELVDQFGFNLPPLFNDSTIEQYVHAENIDQDISNETYSLRYIQNELIRRTMINLPDVLRSKGTQHSIKSFLRTMGIDPDNSLRIKELGGPTKKSLSFSRETKRETGTMVRFLTGSFAQSSYLSSSRVEVGFPEPAGTFVQKQTFSPHGISNNVNDGLLTSGSWSVESIVKWTPVDILTMTSDVQSIGRLMVTGSNSSRGGIISNVVAISSSIDPKLVLYVRSGVSASSPLLTLELPLEEQDNVFDGSRWNVSFGCERNDQILSNVSSSYFLRAARQSNGEIERYFATSSFFYERSNTNDVNVFRSKDTVHNVSGSFFVIGENFASPSGTGSTFRFLNDTAASPANSRVTSLSGLVSNFRFWSKALSESEWKEHVKNYKSRGVESPSTNFNFVTTASGSFERLRLETFTKQIDRTGSGPNGDITFLDFSQNNFHLTGSGFSTSTNALIGELFDHSYLSPVFDEATMNDKVRSRSFIEQSNVDATPWAQVAPLNEILKSEEPTDDVRFLIEFSLVDALNRDIVTMFSSFDSIDNAIGAPELAFSSDYPDIETLRNVYFNRISEKLNFGAFMEFYRWFDQSIGTFIEQLVPRKTLFRGTNFTIESHMLERFKVQYQGTEQYLNETNRQSIENVLLLAQLSGVIQKY